MLLESLLRNQLVHGGLCEDDNGVATRPKRSECLNATNVFSRISGVLPQAQMNSRSFG